MISTQKTRKYRKRPTLLCHYCRDRKVKCDRQLPCSSCRKKRITCIYDLCGVTPSSSTAALPLYTGKNPCSPSDIINFYHPGLLKAPIPSCTHELGPLSWSFVEMKDPAMNILLAHRAAKCFPVHIPGSKIPHIKSVNTYGTEQKFESTLGEIWELTIQRIEIEKLRIDDILGKPEVPLGIRLRSFFLNQRLLVMLIELFFRHIHPLFEHLDRARYLNEITRIFGPLTLTEQPVCQFNLRNRNDLAYVGILIIIARLGYLVVSPIRKGLEYRLGAGETQESLSDVKYILSHPIPLLLMQLAQECFEKLSSLLKPTFETLQFSTFIQIYQKYAPEFGEVLCGAPMRLSNGMVFQMAYTLGLNRDPGPKDDMSEEEKKVRRRIWGSLVFLDVADAYTFGLPLHSDSLYYDTKPPTVSNLDGSEFFEVEYAAYLENFRGLLRIILNVSGTTRVSDIVGRLSALEIFLRDHIGYLSDLSKEETYVKAPLKTTLMNKLAALSSIFLLLVYCHFFLLYEAKGDTELMFFYLRKIIALVVLEHLPSLVAILSGKGTGYSTATEFLVMPSILQLAHASCVCLWLMYARVCFVMFEGKGTLETQTFAKKLDQALRFIFQAVKGCSHRYFYAWNIQKHTKWCFSSSEDESFYLRLREVRDALRFDILLENQLCELNDVLDQGLSKVEQLQTERESADIMDRSVDELWERLMVDKQDLDVLFDF